MILIDLSKAKDISHRIRRQKRAQEFAPLDELIAKQIPGTDVQAVEAQRQAVRDKYAAAQAQLDDCTTPEGLQAVLQSL